MTHSWNIGDRVFVTHDNYGCEAIIIAYRDDDARTAPSSHWQVRDDAGNTFWAFDFEISEVARKDAPGAPYDSTADTIEHIGKVRARLATIILLLQGRAERHDASKLEEPEKSVFDRMTPVLRTLTYGSDEYKTALMEMGAGLNHHYAHNSHHPEHWPDGIAGMSLLDLIEMLADWKAAVERVKDGSMEQSLPINVARFEITPQLAAILRNTVKELGW